MPTIVDGLTTSASSEAVVYAGGRWYSSSLLLSRNSLPQTLRSDTLAGRVVWQWADIDGGLQIVVGVPLPTAGAAYFQFFDQSSLVRTRSALTTVLIVAAGGATLAGAAVGYLVSRRLTASLRTVRDAAARITGGDLALRLPDTGDRELSQLVTNFNVMVGTLAGRIDRDARFSADVSHELRSPLTTLSTSLAVLNTRSEELSAPGRDALRLLTTETARFSRLVEDLLDLSRPDVSTQDFEPLRLGQLLLNVLGRSTGSTIRTEFGNGSLDAFVLGDKRRLEQVFSNLLDNAAAHAGGVTRVGMRVDATTVSVEVDDAGPGVAVAERDRIFERFARGHSAARGSTRGTGLGLALARGHVAAHRGEITVSDAPGGGARFVVTMPRWTP